MSISHLFKNYYSQIFSVVVLASTLLLACGVVAQQHEVDRPDTADSNSLSTEIAEPHPTPKLPPAADDSTPKPEDFPPIIDPLSNGEDAPHPDDFSVHDHEHDQDAFGPNELSEPAAITGADALSIWQQDFMREALLAGLLVALVCGFLSVYIVLKKIVFIGVALTEFSTAGIALALLFSFHPMFGALGFMAVAVTLLALRPAARRISGDGFIGIIYVIAGALAILLVAKSHEGETHMLRLLQGDVLLIDPAESRHMLFAFIGLMALQCLFIKPLVLTSFDRDAASVLGFRTHLYELLQFFAIGVAIAFSIRAAGTLMTTSMLILPAITALLLIKRLKWIFVAAPCIAAAPVAGGLHLSLVADLPASAVIVALSFSLLIFAYIWNVFSSRFL